MPKAINWPSQFLEEVINENTTDVKVALRLGTVYFDHCYYVPDEEVDVRVNHKIIRSAKIFGEMKISKIKDLEASDLAGLKQDIRSIDAVKDYLSKTYEEVVTDETIVTVIYYKNLVKPVGDHAEDPHMS